MNHTRDRMFRTVTTLDTFINRCLDLIPKGPTLSGFEYNRDLLKAAMANTYIETVSSRSDSLHLAIKKCFAKRIMIDTFFYFIIPSQLINKR